MADFTCRTCLIGKHIGCQGCACNVCGIKVRRLQPPRRRLSNEQRRKRRPQRDPSRPKLRPGGAACPKGTSFLPEPMQRAVELELQRGGTLSGVARMAGCSRDQVRTIRDRMEREMAA